MKAIRSLLILLLLLARPAFADRALVIGIDEYPELPDSRLLGCENDARAMARLLQAQGFRVTTILGRDATRQRILQALKDLRARNGAKEKLVVFFAGHGTGPKPATLLTRSSLKASAANDIPAEELYRLVRDIPASGRTVLLDACFSGAMLPSARSIQIRRGSLRPRFYPRAGSAKDLQLVSMADTTQHLAPPVPTPTAGPSRSDVCYFVAARRNEIAQEDEFEGGHHGVFTWYLLSSLKPGMSWSELQAKVTSRVVEHLDDQQHPTITPGFESLALFEPPSGKPGAGIAGSLWEVLNQDRVDDRRINLLMLPDRSTVRVGEQVRFEARAGADGYLVIVEHGVSGRVNLLFPRTESLDAAFVQPGQIVSIPDASLAFAPDAPGKERVRALLFSSRDAADQLIRALRGESPNGAGFGEIVTRLKSRAIGGGLDWQPFTSDLIFQVE